MTASCERSVAPAGGQRKGRACDRKAARMSGVTGICTVVTKASTCAASLDTPVLTRSVPLSAVCGSVP